MIIKVYLPKGVFVGSKERSAQIKEATEFYFSCESLDDAQIFAEKYIGEAVSETNFANDEAKPIADVMKSQFDEQGDHKTHEMKYIEDLLRDVSYNLGSIRIVRSVFFASHHGKGLMGYRIEAAEGERVRVILGKDEGDALINLRPGKLIEAIEAKF